MNYRAIKQAWSAVTTKSICRIQALIVYNSKYYIATKFKYYASFLLSLMDSLKINVVSSAPAYSAASLPKSLVLLYSVCTTLSFSTLQLYEQAVNTKITSAEIPAEPVRRVFRA